jgi:hypothetical protein
MSKVLVTFGGAEYDEITSQVVTSHPGADTVWVYDDAWLEAHEFRKLNSWLWDHRSTLAAPGRGFGWYAWKPLIILDAMARLRPGDTVCYLDADSMPIADISVVFGTAACDGAMLFRACGQRQHQWCTRDCEVTMGLNPSDLARKRYPGTRPQCLTPEVAAGCARWAAFAVGPYKPRQLLYEWLTYAINPMCTTFEPSVLGPEPEGFQEHRTEQAILTMLAHKYGYTLWREADADGNGFMGEDPGDYPQLFEQHRRGGPFPAGSGSRFRNV